MKLFNLKSTIVICFVFLLSACVGDNGKEFLGTWVHSKYPEMKYEISMNGDNFIVKYTHSNGLGGLATRNYAATYKDGIINIPSDMKSISINKSTGNLIDGGSSEYKRID